MVRSPDYCGSVMASWDLLHKLFVSQHRSYQHTIMSFLEYTHSHYENGHHQVVLSLKPKLVLQTLRFTPMIFGQDENDTGQLVQIHVQALHLDKSPGFDNTCHDKGDGIAQGKSSIRKAFKSLVRESEGIPGKLK